MARDVRPTELKDMLRFPAEWGPDEWGPIPLLPDPDILVKRMEKQWGKLENYRGIMTSGEGNVVMGGVKLGSVFFGVQVGTRYILPYFHTYSHTYIHTEKINIISS